MTANGRAWNKIRFFSRGVKSITPTATKSKITAEPKAFAAKMGWNPQIAQPLNVYHYGGDLYQIAAAYAFHIAESQAYLDGNKRTAVEAALGFLEINGVDTDALPEMATYEALIRVANHELDRSGPGTFFRDTLRLK